MRRLLLPLLLLLLPAPLGAKRWPAVAISVGLTGGAGVLRISVGIAIPDRFLFRRERQGESERSQSG